MGNHPQGRENSLVTRLNTPLTDPSTDFYMPNMAHDRLYLKRLDTFKGDPAFKHAKCICVFKSMESEHSYRIRGTQRRSRTYGVGVLTDDNRYYYNEYRTKQTVLSNRLISDMNKLFLEGYRVDNRTAIMLSNDINNRNEPIALFLRVASRTVGVPVLKRSKEKILAALNKRIKLGLKSTKNKDKPHRIATQAAWRLRDMLLEMGYFDFVPEELRREMVAKEGVTYKRRLRLFWCAAGVLFLHLYRDYTKRMIAV